MPLYPGCLLAQHSHTAPAAGPVLGAQAIAAKLLYCSYRGYKWRMQTGPRSPKDKYSENRVNQLCAHLLKGRDQNWTQQPSTAPTSCFYRREIPPRLLFNTHTAVLTFFSTDAQSPDTACPMIQILFRLESLHSCRLEIRRPCTLSLFAPLSAYVVHKL